MSGLRTLRLHGVEERLTFPYDEDLANVPVVMVPKAEVEAANVIIEAARDVVEAGRTEIEDGVVLHALAGALTDLENTQKRQSGDSK